MTRGSCAKTQPQAPRSRRCQPSGGAAAVLEGEAGAGQIGVEPVDLGVGGSIPFIADLVREFPEAQILVTGVEDPHSRAHSPNESLHLDTFRNAVRSEALLLARMNRRGGGDAVQS